MHMASTLAHLAGFLYGARGGPVAVVASGDGGWVHLAPEVAELLSARGWFVVGLDSKAYLATIVLGASTTTDDAEGEVLSTVDASHVEDDAIAAEVAKLSGPIQQVPSAVSAAPVPARERCL